LKYNGNNIDAGSKKITPLVLKSFSKQQLTNLAKSKGIELPEKDLDKETLIDIILKKIDKRSLFID